MEHSIPLDDQSRADDPEQDKVRDDGTHEIRPDLAYKRLLISNVFFYGLPAPSQPGPANTLPPTHGQWVLIDAGVMGTSSLIANAARERFGAESRPAAIILTHGHFDHVGALKSLAEQWDVPIYAHALELPYLNGEAAYPPPDPTVDKGLMSVASPLYPRDPIDVRTWLKALPSDQTVPFMPGWQWIHTPGHSPGHISLWRAEDNTLIAGDAFITTAQESAYAVVTQRLELHGPPMYYTQDWQAAGASVDRLAALEPEIVGTGHGRPMRGAEMREALNTLARNFDVMAVPDHGRYVQKPARAQDGSAYRTPSSD